MLKGSSGSELKLNRLENIEEDNALSWLPATCPPPETPTESMEFLARSWSLSAMELSNALCHVQVAKPPSCSPGGTAQADSGSALLSQQDPNQPLPASDSPPLSPRGSNETKVFPPKSLSFILKTHGTLDHHNFIPVYTIIASGKAVTYSYNTSCKELLQLHQALNQELPSNQQLIKNGLYRSIIRSKKVGRCLKDQKERKKQEIRAHNAQLHAAISVAGVAAAVAALAASSITSPEKAAAQNKNPTGIASAAALVASHCIEVAEDMGADHEQILSVVNSAINARTNGDIMTLTAGAATALRGAATLRARLHKVHGPTIALNDENVQNSTESNTLAALDFVTRGEELLKCTRKGDLHWKLVSFNINSNLQVVAKMKSKHMGGTFTKKKKCIVSDVYCDIPAWPGRETENNKQMAYFAIQTADRIIEFECRNKSDKQMWVEGIQHMLHLSVKMT